MLRQYKLTRKAAVRFVQRDPGHDMALAVTLVFFGVFPIMLVSGLLLIQILGAH